MTEEEKFKEACARIVKNTKESIIQVSFFNMDYISDYDYLIRQFKLLHEAKWYLDEK